MNQNNCLTQLCHYIWLDFVVFVYDAITKLQNVTNYCKQVNKNETSCCPPGFRQFFRLR